MSFESRISLVVALLTFPNLCSFADEPGDKSRLKPGDNALHFRFCKFVNGYWATRKGPDDRQAKQRPRLALYTRQLSPEVVRLIQRLDGQLPLTDDWEKSFVVVSHENAPMPTEAQQESRLKEIRTIAELSDVRHISIGLLNRVKESSRRLPRNVGVFEHGDPVVMIVVPEHQEKRSGIRRDMPVPYKSKIGFIKHIQPGQADSWTNDMIARDLASSFVSSTKNRDDLAR